MPVGRIESLDHEARGIARLDGKTVFVDGALPGEVVEYASYRRKPSFELAQLVKVIQASPARVRPRCAHYGVCGGCAMQHLDPGSQVAAKQRVLENSLWHIGRVKPETILPPIHGQAWEYRHRARMSARLISKKGGVLIGFHERKSSYITDMLSCEVLPPRVSALLAPLRVLVTGLSISDRMPQVEFAVGAHCIALVFRVLEPLTAEDEARFRAFANTHQVLVYLQPKGPDSTYRFHPVDGPKLSYTLPEYDLEMEFRPTDFTQVNHAVNRILVRRAMQLLDPRPGERVADMFCGLGNFTLPIARLGATVLGVEGSAALVARGQQGAIDNGLNSGIAFATANLFQCTPESIAALGAFDKMLIDPPREGAIELVKSLSIEHAPGRIVYVSCNPATLARDAEYLVHALGYRLVAAGAVNMFPHTAHVESIALFER